MDIATVVYTEVRQVAQQQNKTLPPLTNDLPLLESGLDSLCIAILIASLDDKLKLSPFDADDVAMPVTLGDLVAIYQHATTAV